MKPTAHAYLENESFKAVMEVKRSISGYEEAGYDFFKRGENPERFRNAKKMKDEAIARLFELETARKVIKEMENKGVEL